MNVGYNLLSAQVWKNVLRFGLDPFMGYLHVERSGRMSLVYDLVEPFRPMVDRFIISFLRGLDKNSFSGDKKNKTIADLKNNFFSDFMVWKLEYKGKKFKIETIMFLYVQEVVSFLRGQRDSITCPYIPW